MKVHTQVRGSLGPLEATEQKRLVFGGFDDINFNYVSKLTQASNISHYI